MVGTCTAWGVARFVGGARSGSATGLRSAWTVDYPGQRGATDTESGRLFASWLVDGLIIRVQPDGVIAYKLADGSKAWATPVPEGASMCAATPTAAQGMAAIAFGPDTKCDKVAAVSLKDGSMTWTATVPAEEVQSSRGMRKAPLLAATGSSVLVQAVEKDLIAFGLADGRQRWRASADKYCRLRGLNADDKTVVMGQSCREHTVQALDAATGATRWRTATGDSYVSAVVSVSPTVVLMSGWKSISDSPLLVFGETGEKKLDIPSTIDGIEVDNRELDNATLGVQGRRPFLVRGDTLYVRTALGREPKPKSKDEILAIDLSTGKRRWGSSGHAAGTITLIRVDDKGLLAMEAGAYGTNPRLVHIQPDTGKASVVVEAPAHAMDGMMRAQIHEHDGTVVMLPFQRWGNHAIVALRPQG